MRMCSSDKDYEGESLARTLSEADSIRGDKKKLAMAKAGANRLAKNKMKEALSMKKIAGSKKPMKKIAKKKGAK